VENFTVGRDREMDMLLAQYDVLGSVAHAVMLEDIGLLTKKELQDIRAGLKEILEQIRNGSFTIEEGIEDVHSQVELQLTRMIGDAGKRIHTGRSRNDQVLLDIKLYMRDQLKAVVRKSEELFGLLLELSEEHKDKLLPGYTHLQLTPRALPMIWKC
jgi:argininosuccinate lyase